MMRLTVLFLLFPVVLFGQNRRKAIVDSIKVAGNDLRRVATVIKNSPGAGIDNINVSDSDGYVTLVVRVKLGDASAIPALALLPIVKMKTGAITAHSLSEVAIPPLPRIAEDAVTPLPLLAVATISIPNIAHARMDGVTIPPLPFVKEDIEALPVLAGVHMRTENIVAEKLNTLTVPRLPDIKVDIKALTFLAVVPVKGADIVTDKLTIVAIPALPPIEPWLEALPLSASVQLPVEYIRVSRIETIEVPAFAEIRVPVEEMHLSDEGYSLLEKMEGFSPELYSLGDGGFTIGFGFFVPYNEAGKWKKGVTLEEADRLIRLKVPAYEDQVKKYINVPLTQEEFDALTMLAYNLGGFSKATSIVNDINNNADFEQLQRDWMRFVHSKAPNVMRGLMNRRRDEMAVGGESNYQPHRKVLIFKHNR